MCESMIYDHYRYQCKMDKPGGSGDKKQIVDTNEANGNNFMSELKVTCINGQWNASSINNYKCLRKLIFFHYHHFNRKYDTPKTQLELRSVYINTKFTSECEPLPSQHCQGSFVCQKKNLAAGYACKYSCTGSNVPDGTASTTCKEIKNSNGVVVDYEWEPKVQQIYDNYDDNDPNCDSSENKFACVSTMK